MKIGLISPKGNFLAKDKAFAEFIENSKELQVYLNYFWSGFSTALPLIAALTPSNFKVKIIDENFEQIDFDGQYDLIGVTAMTQQAGRAYKIMDEFRKRKVKVIMGGIHATTMPQEAKDYADSVAIGEAENLWPEILRDFQNNRLKQFYNTREPVALQNNPIPRYSLLSSYDYRRVWVQSSRGCSHDCEFCVASRIYGHRYRHKRVEQVIEEISLIKKIWPNVRIGFADDNMFNDRKYSISLVEKIKDLYIKWDAQTDISIGNDEKLLKLLKEAGCIALFIGLESVSGENLRSIDNAGWKFRQSKSYSDYIKRIQSYGIGILGAFIVGLDNDDDTIFQKTIDFIIENNIAGAQITVLSPLPGCRLTDRLQKEKRILTKDWDLYTGWDVVFIPKKMSRQELQEGVLEVYRQVYSDKNRTRRAKYFKKIYHNLLN